MSEKVFLKPEYVLAQEVDNDTILLNIESEYYFALDDVGTRFWKVLQSVTTIDEAVNILQSEYEVDHGTLAKDLESFIASLEEKKLLIRAPK